MAKEMCFEDFEKLGDGDYFRISYQPPYEKEGKFYKLFEHPLLNDGSIAARYTRALAEKLNELHSSYKKAYAKAEYRYKEACAREPDIFLSKSPEFLLSESVTEVKEYIIFLIKIYDNLVQKWFELIILNDNKHYADQHEIQGYKEYLNDIVVNLYTKKMCIKLIDI